MYSELIFNGYHLPTLAKVVREMGSPTFGPVACKVWNITNMNSLPIPIAEQFARDCGYEPFRGYPLTRCQGAEVERG